MKKDMRWKVAQIGMLTTMLAMESILPQGHIVDARHQTAQYRIEEDMELAGLSSYVRGGQAEGAYVSETIARVHDQWQQKKQEEKQKQRIRQQKLEQERMRKERQKRKQEQRKRARRARIRRAKQKQKRDEKNRRLAIEEKCGRVIGTESERILQRIVEAEAGGGDLEGRAHCCECHFESCVRKTVSIHDQGSSLCTQWKQISIFAGQQWQLLFGTCVKRN